jgi:putative ABC transport system ATP-binding protein
MSILQAIGLGKQVRVGDRELVILHAVDFAVAAGEAIAIVGASGSGKTTLLGLLAGLDTPSTGKVLLDDVDLFSLNEDQRAALRGRLLGFVFQSFQLLSALTALENIMLPLELARRNDARDSALTLLKKVGLTERAHHYPKQLSGGEQQRVAIARAFAGNPRLLLADEPTGNLDASTGEEIIDLMFALNAEQRTTLVIVTHDAAISKRCGRQLKLASGRLQGGDAP